MLKFNSTPDCTPSSNRSDDFIVLDTYKDLREAPQRGWDNKIRSLRCILDTVLQG